ncbi:MAG: tRNA pseudouridine(13) synthase TruD [Phycisphaerales bacterium]|nr:MAG: tRNA pseudouridine(13) synthase TruD [Phycisphaerales bacterium]
MLPFSHADFAPLPSAIKKQPADFVVEEIPAYEPCGQGTHLYFGIEKMGLATIRAIEEIARLLGTRPDRIGYAGRKDAEAITRQVLSIEHVEPEKVAALEHQQIKVLWTRRHTNKLKLGHLRGNRFTVRLRETEPERLGELRDRLAVLEREGAPNYFGTQRFGAGGRTWKLGQALLAEDWVEMAAVLLGRPGEADTGAVQRARALFEQGAFLEAARAWPRSHRDEGRAARVLAESGDERRAMSSLHPRARRLYVDSLQAHVFNQVLAQRIDTMGRVMEGDVAWLHRNGATFAVEDRQREQARCEAGEISPSGPLFGPKMKAATGEPRRIERAALEETGLREEMFAGPAAGKCQGGRRALRMFPEQTRTEAGKDTGGAYLEIGFTLRPGCYATSLLRELCHAELTEPERHRPSE